MLNKINQTGQSLLEVIVAVALFGLISAALATFALGGTVAIIEGGAESEAENLAQEAIEAAKAIRDNGYNSLYFAQSAISTSSEGWFFVGEGTSEIIGNYTRTISITDVCRDINDDIASCPGVYTDIYTKSVSVTVEWLSNRGVLKTVERQVYLSNWESEYWIQTDWQGGGGQYEWALSNRYNDADGIDNGASGQVTLAVDVAEDRWVFTGGEEVEDDTNSDFSTGVFTDTVIQGTGTSADIEIDGTEDWVPHIDSETGEIEKDVFDMHILSYTDAWYVGDSGNFYHYDGANWTEFVDLAGTDVYTLDMVSATDGWAGAGRGPIYHYNGTTWSLFQDTGAMDWRGIDMLSATDGFIVGEAGEIYRYNGTTWSQFMDTGSQDWYDVFMTSSTDGWLVGSDGEIYRYNGTTWSQFMDTGAQTWRAIHMLTDANGWLVGDGGQIMYYNGSTWVSVVSPVTTDLNDVYFVGPSNGWAVGDSGKIIHYDGSNWIEVQDSGSWNWYTVEFYGSETEFIGGGRGRLYEYREFFTDVGYFESRIFDNGALTTWNALYWVESTPSDTDITIATRSGDTATPDGTWSSWSKELSNPSGSVITSPDARYFQYRATLTSDSFNTTTPELDSINIVYNAPTGEYLYAVDYVNENNLWAVGLDGFIVNSTGGGWVATTSPVVDHLYGLDMLSDNTGWAVGGGGKIIYYNGLIWSEHTDTGNQTWNDIYCVSASDCHVVGDGGEIYHYNGTAWSTVTSPTNQDLNEVYLLNTTNGWAVGASGVVLYYNGSSWSLNVDLGSITLNTVHFVTSTDGYLAGGSGKIYHYDGVSWAEYVDTGNDTWNSIFFNSATDGWVVGNGGVIRSFDGISWELIESPTSYNINDLIMITEYNGWGVGEKSAVVHYISGNDYEVDGYLESSYFNLDGISPVQLLEWDEDLSQCPTTCAIHAQVRTAPDSGGSPGTWTEWYGVSGSNTYFHTAAGSIVPPGVNGNIWAQYRVELEGDGENTPILQEVRVNYR